MLRVEERGLVCGKRLSGGSRARGTGAERGERDMVCMRGEVLEPGWSLDGRFGACIVNSVVVFPARGHSGTCSTGLIGFFKPPVNLAFISRSLPALEKYSTTQHNKPPLFVIFRTWSAKPWHQPRP